MSSEAFEVVSSKVIVVAVAVSRPPKTSALHFKPLTIHAFGTCRRCAYAAVATTSAATTLTPCLASTLFVQWRDKFLTSLKQPTTFNRTEWFIPQPTMKHRYGKRDFSKFAWASRLTAPVIKVDLIISCHNLPKKDLLSQADAFCVLWQIPNGYSVQRNQYGVPAKLPGRQEEERGRTEVSRACVNPTFKHKFRLEYSFHEEQTYVLRVYDEDLRYATDLKEHDYLGGCVFTIGQLMGAKGCALARKLGQSSDQAYMVVTGEEILETREVLEFRFSCQDLVKEQNIIDQSKVLDQCRPYFRLERLNRDDQSWELVWKSEVIKDTLDPTWMEARLPLQLLCNDDQTNPLKITIWDYEKHSSSHDLLGFVESTVAEIIEKAKDGQIPVFIVMREKRKLFRGSKLKHVGLLKVLKASVITIPSMMQYLSGGCSLDLVIGIDCTTANGEWGTEKNLHFSAAHWMNDYQAGIQKLGSIAENFARGRHSSLWGLGAELKGEYRRCYAMEERLCEGAALLKAYDDHVAENPTFALGKPCFLKPLIQAATFRTIKSSRRRQCYTVLTVFTAGDIVDLPETVDLICTAAEDAPISIVIIGVGNSDFGAIEKLCGDDNNGRLRDSRGIPIAREIVTFVSFKQFGGNASEVIAEALKDVPEQFVEYHVMNGSKPLARVPPPNFAKMMSPQELVEPSSSSGKGNNGKHIHKRSKPRGRSGLTRKASRSRSP